MTNDYIFNGWISESERLSQEGEPYINRQSFTIGVRWCEDKLTERASELFCDKCRECGECDWNGIGKCAELETFLTSLSQL